MKYYEKIFTPEEAIDIVENKNDNYRKLKYQKVMEYTKMMKDGKWCEDNGEPITFYSDGKLANGQHRLYAIHESGIPLRFLVVEGVSREATETIDMGVKRSSEDAIRYKLRGTGKELAVGSYSITKQVMLLRKRCKTNSQSPYKMNMTELETRDECLSDVIGYNEASEFGRKIKKDSSDTIKPNEAGSIFYYLVHDFGLNREYVKNYFEKLCSAARNDVSIFNTTISNLSKPLKNSDRYNELIWGWNSYVRGCTRKRCQFSGWFEFPEDKSCYGETSIMSMPGYITEEEASAPVNENITLADEVFRLVHNS